MTDRGDINQIRAAISEVEGAHAELKVFKRLAEDSVSVTVVQSRIEHVLMNSCGFLVL